MTLTKNSLLNFFLNEKLQKIASIICLASIGAVLVFGAMEIFFHIKTPLLLQFVLGGPFIVGLMGMVFLGGPILHLMAEYGDYSRDSHAVMRGMGNFFTFLVGIAITTKLGAAIELDFTHLFWVAFFAKIACAVFIGMIYHQIVKGIIQKLVL